jgi:hypothetical protein
MFLALPSILQFSLLLHSLHTLCILNFKVNYSAIPALFGLSESFVEEARPHEDGFGSGKVVFFFVLLLLDRPLAFATDNELDTFGKLKTQYEENLLVLNINKIVK